MKTMTYLGALFNGEGSCDEEIENRIKAVPKVIFAMRSEALERKRAEQGKKVKSICCNGGAYVTVRV